jgi:hypothetical protein
MAKCGLVLTVSPNGKVAIFFTGNGTLLGKFPEFLGIPEAGHLCQSALNGL